MDMTPRAAHAAHAAPAPVWAPYLIILTVLAMATLLASLALDLMILPGDAALGHDFSAFYAAGLAVRKGLDPYNWAQLGLVEAHLRSIGNPNLPLAFNSYANPPFFTLLMAACTRLPDRPLYVLWTGAMAAALIAGSVVLPRSCGVPRRGWIGLLFTLTPASIICLFLGQQTPLLLLGLALSLVALRSDRPALAGVLLTVGWIKPHLLFPVAMVIVLTLNRRMMRQLLAGFLGVSLALGIVSWLALGGQAFAAWARDLLSYGRTVDVLQPDLSSLAGIYLSVLARPWSTWAMAAALGLWVGLAGLLVYRGRRDGLTPTDDGWLRLVAIALVTWLLATPYTHPADLILLAVALPVLLGARLQHIGRAEVRLALTALLVAPEADLLGFRPNFVLSYSVLVPLTFLLALRPWSVLSTRQFTDDKCERADPRSVHRLWPPWNTRTTSSVRSTTR